MPIELLKKGQVIDLTKKDASLNLVRVALGFGKKEYDGGSEFDLDVTVFGLQENGKCREDADVVYYHQNHLKHPSGAIIHSGDARVGSGDGDDETITLDLSKMPAHIETLAFVVTIDEAHARRQNFGMVPQTFVRVDNAESGEQLIKYQPHRDANLSTQTALLVGELSKYNNSWSFKAVGEGFEAGLDMFVKKYGLIATKNGQVL